MNNSSRLTLVGGVAALVSVLPLLVLTQDWDWLLPAALAIALVTATGYLGRLLRIPGGLEALVQIAVLTWWLGLLIAADLAWMGVFPSTAWPERFELVFREGAETINIMPSPVPVTDGVLIFLVGGAGVVALLIDMFSASLKRTVLTGAPIAACYAVTAAVEGGNIGWWWFIAPAVAYLAMLLTESRARVAAWGRVAAPSGPRGVQDLPGVDALARNGRRVGAFALIAAVTIPAAAPALSDGFVQGRGSGGGGGDGRTIRTDNPILDLQRNLNRPDNVDVLRYRASDDAPHYIRTVTLDSFDGDVWQTSDRPVPESQRVNEGLPDPPGMDLDDPPEIEFDFEITDNYSSRWLPLAYPAQEIEIAGDWRYDNDTLDVVSTDDDVLGTEYTAVSLDVTVDAETLRNADEPDSDLSDATELPDDLPPIVTELAEEVTRDRDTDFGRAAALQEWFRGPEFTYDTSTQPGTSAGAVADFLNDRTGYCEQFAATMAIMARHLGIPARVAVGFTPGTYEGNDTWLVRSHDSHAWPELYFDGVGWVRFEPTPAGRTGTAPSWTVQPVERTPSDNSPVPDSTATAAPNEDPETPIGGRDFEGGVGSTGDGASRWPWVVAAAVLGAAILALVPTGLARLRSWRRWARAGDDPADVAAAAWAQFRETVRDAGLSWDDAATPRSAGRSVAAGAGLWDESREMLDHLVSVVERSRYSRSAEPVAGLRADTAMLCRTIMRSRPLRRQVRAFLWPSSLRDGWASLSRKASSGLDRIDTAGDRTRAYFDRRLRTALRR
ncbi:transglutaminase family protein [Phytoactinopolyspora halotolerans]|uniref:Transglutaminase domain-containing protein n=1 Tax=Phytoactinopolyspora halotolerans TaxID=1981512 RepID=A0A6L9SF05_9ACTN|nr:DUF3488 and transglutaminase-like domain-containing protein [Phytoactinopolyspora halotolerans]NEE03081.1 transglutaminase domain-containing protein [Phytoactinopolyspora halotolerans]